MSTKKLLLGLALTLGTVPVAASAQRHDQRDARRYTYVDKSGRHFDRLAWRQAEERRKAHELRQRHRDHRDGYRESRHDGGRR